MCGGVRDTDPPLLAYAPTTLPLVESGPRHSPDGSLGGLQSLSGRYGLENTVCTHRESNPFSTYEKKG
jgi:hypothetical protein